MTETTSVTAISQPAVGAPATTQTAGTQTTTAPAGAVPDVDWSKFDWESNAEKIPWDKLDVKRIEQIPNVRKMQASHERRMRDFERKARQEREALQQQINQFQQLIAGSSPELAQQMQTYTQQNEYAAAMRELETYKEMEARKLIANQYEIPEDVVFGFQGGPDEVLTQAMEYQRTNSVQQKSQLQQQLEALQRQMEALTRQATDPAANQPVNVAAQGANPYQARWEELVNARKGDEAERILQEARSKGLTLRTETIKPKGWA